MTAFLLSTNPTNGFYLRCDASGNGTWAVVPTPQFANGTAGAPSITFLNDATTGLFLSTGPSVLGLSVASTQVMSFSSTAATVANGRTLNVGTSGTTSPLNVFGLITGNNGLTISSGATSLQATTTNGLLTAATGLTVSNGQTTNIGTSGTTSPLNVFGVSTLNARMSVTAGGASITGTPSTTNTSAGTVIQAATFTTSNTSPVFMTYISGTPINTAGGIPTEAYNVYIDNPPTGATNNYNLYINGGRSFINSGVLFRVTSVAVNAYTVLNTDFCVIFTVNGAKTATLPSPVPVGMYLIIANIANNNVSLASGTNLINGATTGTTARNVATNANIALMGITTTRWIIV